MTLHRALLAVATAAWTLTFQPAALWAAGDGPQMSEPQGVVELFTSQGCSSCPPADAALAKLVEEGRVLALSYHVDYWNYLGWEDTLGTKENTERQYAYSRMLGRNGVYTPQAIMNGRDHINGGDLDGIRTRLAGMNSAGKGMVVPIMARLSGDEMKISVGAGKGKAVILAVYFKQRQDVNVERGENGGKRITYWNSVSDVQTIGMWDGLPVDLVLPATLLTEDDNSGCAILLQRMKDGQTPGAIVGATSLLAAAKTASP